MTTLTLNEGTTFYDKLQQCPDLDLRDTRGKVHDLAFILLSVTLGLLCKRDGCLSSIHRHMVNKNKALCLFLGISAKKVVSRSHLSIVLQKVNLHVFENLLYETYKIELSQEEKHWFSGDGKELKGSIRTGNKRGEAIVQLVRHQDRAVLGQAYYDGNKESEKPCLRQLMLRTHALTQKISLDALHLCPETTTSITQAGGLFLIGLKANQKELLEDMKNSTSFLQPVNQKVTLDKGHGRLEKRTYTHYDISREYFDERWEKSDFQSLFKVQRTTTILSTNIHSEETAYYISNGGINQDNDYFGAIRAHWAVEVNNHVRDVTLKEDCFTTKKSK